MIGIAMEKNNGDYSSIGGDLPLAQRAKEVRSSFSIITTPQDTRV